MNPRIDIIRLGKPSTSDEWSLGEILVIELNHRKIRDLIERTLTSCGADGFLFWDASLPAPDPATILRIWNSPGDVWHAGLNLGLESQPSLMDAIAPTWMLNRDPDPDIEATSWRLSLQACLIKKEVLRQMGGPIKDFEGLPAASLELGHRFVTNGVVTRCAPALLDGEQEVESVTLSLYDEALFAYQRFGSKWCRWALFRGVIRGEIDPLKAFKVWRRVKRVPTRKLGTYQRSVCENIEWNPEARVSVLIPTVDRYPYLETLLDQLRKQTVPVHDIIIVDQTKAENRDASLFERYGDLPLKVIVQDEAGQCSSRNAGLNQAEGDYVLFIDDDDEVEPDLIERHLRTLSRFENEVSCGVNEEAGAGPIPENFRFLRASDVFPTNNSLIKTEVLRRSKLFDLAYNRGQRADGDLGMRLYLSGALMMLNPEISVFHHHAPSGGLRKHKARVVTYASSRNRMFHRQLPSVTEIYLGYRYFTERQVSEMLWLKVLGTFSHRGGKLQKLLKAFVSACCLPHTISVTQKRKQIAKEMLKTYPKIPALEAAPQFEPIPVAS